MATPRLDLTRTQILSYRRAVGELDERLPRGRRSLRRAAWAGLQDSMPRAALLSIHARVEGTEATTWEDPSLVQLWGPRYHAYIVAAQDLAIFSLGRLPDGGASLQVAEDLAARLHAMLEGESMTYGEAGAALGVDPNRLRYAAATGTVLIRWDGARQPTVWTVPRPEVDPRSARLELARRHLHIFGPTTPEAFAEWAGIGPSRGVEAFETLARSLTAVRTPVGDAWILKRDEPAFRAVPGTVAPARLLPSGDAFFLLQGGRPRTPGPRRRASSLALDAACLAGRPPRRGRDRRDLASCAGCGGDPDLAPSLARDARCRRGRSGIPSPARDRGADHRPLGLTLR